MSRRRERADELRAMFVANRERVRSWVADFDVPGVSWPGVPRIPAPWVVPERDERRWLERYAPHLDDYRWSLAASPATADVATLEGSWWFGPGHGFLRLEIVARTAPVRRYLAATLAAGVHAAALRGWSDGDEQLVEEWLHTLFGRLRMGRWVRERFRVGHVSVEATAFADRPGEVTVQLVVTETDAAGDGSPLDEEGRARHPSGGRSTPGSASSPAGSRLGRRGGLHREVRHDPRQSTRSQLSGLMACAPPLSIPQL